MFRVEPLENEAIHLNTVNVAELESDYWEIGLTTIFASRSSAGDIPESSQVKWKESYASFNTSADLIKLRGLTKFFHAPLHSAFLLFLNTVRMSTSKEPQVQYPPRRFQCLQATKFWSYCVADMLL